MMNLPLSFYSLASQRILSQASNISYGVRGVYRTEVTPEDRKADYNFRDYQVTLLTNCLSEVGFRAIQTLYASPRMTEVLGLNRLSQIYGDKYPDVEIRNYSRLPEIVRARLMGTLVRKDSIHKVPDLLEKMETDLLKSKNHQLSEPEQKQLRILLEHLHKSLNFKDYLYDLTQGAANGRFVTQESALTQVEADFVLAQRKQILDLHGGPLLAQIQKARKADAAKRPEELAKLRDAFKALQSNTARLGTPADLQHLEQLNLEGSLKAIIESPSQKGSSPRFMFWQKDPQKQQLSQLHGMLEKHFAETAKHQNKHLARLIDSLDWSKELPGHEISDTLRRKLATLIDEGVTADKVLSKLVHIQKNSTWPQIACSILFTFLFYGTAANFFDVKVLQPWQKKLVEERGSSEAYVKPSYLATIPALAVLGGGLQNKFQLNAIRRLSYFNRFAVMTVAATLAYIGSFLPLLKRELNKTAPRPVTTPPVAPPPASPLNAGTFSAGKPVQPYASTPASPFHQAPLPH